MATTEQLKARVGKTVEDIIRESEEKYPHIPNQPDHEIYTMMHKRQQYMINTYGDMPQLNDED